MSVSACNKLFTELARTVPGFTSPRSLHTSFASKGCVKDPGLNNPVTASHRDSMNLLCGCAVFIMCFYGKVAEIQSVL